MNKTSEFKLCKQLQPSNVIFKFFCIQDEKINGRKKINESFCFLADRWLTYIACLLAGTQIILYIDPYKKLFFGMIQLSWWTRLWWFDYIYIYLFFLQYVMVGLINEQTHRRNICQYQQLLHHWHWYEPTIYWRHVMQKFIRILQEKNI